jgi:uncharacterized membrane protein YcaP (DUF421 family)
MTLQSGLVVVGVVLLVLAVLRLARKRESTDQPGIDGKSHWIYRGGVFDLPLMQRAGISRADIEDAVRRNAVTLREVREVRLEPSGELSVIR